MKVSGKNSEGRILFTSQGNLWVINPDGTKEEKICDITDYRELLFSPSKKKLAGIKDNDLFIMNWDGTGGLNVSKSPEIECINSFSPDGDKVICAVKATMEDTRGFLGIISINGTTYVKVKEFMITPKQSISWSPDKQRVTLIVNNKLYIMSVRGEWVKNLGDENLQKINPYNPSWSPDGKRIAFRANKSGTGDLWIINIESEGHRSLYISKVLSKKSELPRAAEWSPGGEALVFEAPNQNSKENNIYMVYVDGTLKLLGKGYKPFWSLDGKKILCESEEGKLRVFNTGIYSYSSSRNYPPFWSPEFFRLAYTNPVKKEIWILDIEKNKHKFLTGRNSKVLGWLED